MPNLETLDGDLFEPDTLDRGGVPKPRPCCCHDLECAYYTRNWKEPDTSDLGDYWDTLSGSAQILDGKLAVSSGSLIRCTYQPENPNDPHVVSAYFYAGSSSDRPRLSASVLDANNLWFLEWVPGFASGVFTLYQRASGSDTPHGSITIPHLGAGKWAKLQIRFGESAICAYVGESVPGSTEALEVATYPTDTLTDNYIGVGASAGSTVQVGTVTISHHGEDLEGCPICNGCPNANNELQPYCLEATFSGVAAGDGEPEHCAALNRPVKMSAVSPCLWKASPYNLVTQEWAYSGSYVFTGWVVRSNQVRIEIGLLTGYVLEVRLYLYGVITSGAFATYRKSLGAPPDLLTLDETVNVYSYTSGRACDYSSSSVRVRALTPPVECVDNIPCHFCGDTIDTDSEMLVEITATTWTPGTFEWFDVDDSFLLTPRDDGGCQWYVRANKKTTNPYTGEPVDHFFDVVFTLHNDLPDPMPPYTEEPETGFQVVPALNIAQFPLRVGGTYDPITQQYSHDLWATGMVDCDFDSLALSLSYSYRGVSYLWAATVTKQ